MVFACSLCSNSMTGLHLLARISYILMPVKVWVCKLTLPGVRGRTTKAGTVHGDSPLLIV